DFKARYKSLKSCKHGFNILVILHQEELILLNQKICNLKNCIKLFMILYAQHMMGMNKFKKRINKHNKRDKG
ncbi:hypothetical protein A2U01_0060692, partial [Trifolium medium]|nr:hypothetical protein [Trifolium medium]